MGILLAALLALPLAAQTPEERNPRTSPADIAAGAQTFRSHCSTCHGMKGEGGRGPSLATGQFFHGSTDAALLQNISRGIPGTEMPGIFYNADRVWQVVAYVRSLSAGAAAPKGNAAAGLKIYRASGCPGCHRIKGEGGRFGPDLTAIGRVRSLEHLRNAVVKPDADVRPRFWVVQTGDAKGKYHDGFLLNEDTYTVQIIDFTDQLWSLNKADLNMYKISKTSRMPSFADRVTGANLDNLVSYLASLRGGAK
jgi:cytochrome c oxidase cbb3-type subunit III